MASDPRLTYRRSGVDIQAADRLVSRIGKLAAATRGAHVVSGVGLFAAAVRIPRGYRSPLLMAATDGVGTKLAVARLVGKHDTVGVDLVAMSVNDLLTSGARPLCFLDYLSVGSLPSVDAEAIVRGIADGCRLAGTSLVGGETAEMPGFYRDGEYDLAGFAVGVVEEKKLLDGSKIRAGDALVGLESSGLHSNGYSLARAALRANDARALRRRPRELDETLGEALLRPTRIYVKPVLAALERFAIKGMAHITGGGLPGNLVRILPKGTAAVIARDSLPESSLLELIRTQGNVARSEMDRTFNGGIGYVIATKRSQADDLCTFLKRRRTPARVIGEVVAGKRRVSYSGR